MGPTFTSPGAFSASVAPALPRLVRWPAVPALLAIALAAAPSASAKTIVVSPGGAIATIQAGVDAAGPGDTVLVKKGVYHEAVTVPPGKDGLQIVGKGKVVIDGRGPGGVPLRTGLTVASNGVRVRGIAFRHQTFVDVNDPGRAISATGDGLKVEKCVFANTGSTAIVADGDATEVVGCRAKGVSRFLEAGGSGLRVRKCRVEASGEAVTADGANASIEKCRFRVISERGIETSGDGSVVTGCRIDVCALEAIVVSGDESIVRKCRIQDVDDDGIVVLGDIARIKKNRIRACDGVAILVDAQESNVSNNRLRDVGEGIRVTDDEIVIRKNRIRNARFGPGISTSAGPVSIVANRVRGVAGGERGIEALTAFGDVIADNRVRSTTSDGVFLDDLGPFTFIGSNNVRDAGADDRDDTGLLVAAHDCILSKNRVRGALSDGIRVSGDDTTLVKNRSSRNGVDGIDVEAVSGIVLKKNRTTKNQGEGIENGSTDAVVVKNRSKGNRTDFANSGTVAEFKKNKIADGSGPATSPEVD